MRWQQEREEAKVATSLMKKIKHDADLERLVTLAMKNEVKYEDFFHINLLTCIMYTIDCHIIVFLYEVVKKFFVILKNQFCWLDGKRRKS